MIMTVVLRKQTRTARNIYISYSTVQQNRAGFVPSKEAYTSKVSIVSSRDQSSVSEDSWKSCNNFISAFAISALPFHTVSQKETILPLLLPPRRGTEQ